MLGLRRTETLVMLIVMLLEVQSYLLKLRSIAADEKAILTWVGKYLEGCGRCLPADTLLIFVYADQDVQPML
jgi:hypothetical protein